MSDLHFLLTLLCIIQLTLLNDMSHHDMIWLITQCTWHGCSNDSLTVSPFFDSVCLVLFFQGAEV